jgi:broad-specificity NMP kinase
MARYLITGYSGTGKSTIAKELQQRQYTAYDTDRIRGLTHYAHPKTGRRMYTIPFVRYDLSKMDWNWNARKFHRLLTDNDDVFVCGITSNQDKYLQLFDKVFVLTLDAQTIEHRVATRTTSVYGKLPNEMAHILSTFESFNDFMRRQGAIPIDASLPISEVVDSILEQTNDH